MSRLLLVDPAGLCRAVADRLRNSGHEVLEADGQEAWLKYREGLETMLVCTAEDAAGVASLLQELPPDRRPAVLFLAPPSKDDAEPAASTPRPKLLGETTAMRDLRATLRRLALRPRTHVLVCGEPGTGKHTLACVLHRASVELEHFVQASPEQLPALLDSGLGELGARGGTLYVTNLEAVPRAEQRRLAAMLSERDVSTRPPLRLIVATALAGKPSLERGLRDLAHPDLAARLPVLLELLPLRKRRDDVPLLARHFLKTSSLESSLPPPEIAADALEKLVFYAWPGNVRELANVLEHAALTGEGTIGAERVPPFDPAAASVDFELSQDGIDLGELERAVLSQALRLAGGNQTRAAALVGLTRDQIRYRMSKFGLPRAIGSREDPSP